LNATVGPDATRVQSGRLSSGVESVDRLIGSNCGIENCVVKPLGSVAWLSNNIPTAVELISSLELKGLADCEGLKWWLIHEEESATHALSVESAWRAGQICAISVSVSTNWLIQLFFILIFISLIKCITNI
jgi:hypothetical protein